MSELELGLAKLAVILLIVGGCFGGGMYVEHHYIDAATLEKQIAANAAQKAQDTAKITALQVAYNTAVANANAAAAATSTASQQAIDAIDVQLTEKQNEVNALKKTLDAQAEIIIAQNIAATTPGTTGGLSINGASCSTSTATVPVSGSGNTQPSSGPGDQTSCRLTEKTARSLISIAADGDAAINQLNAVIDAYNKVKEKGCAPDPAKSTTNAATTQAAPTGETVKPKAIVAPTSSLVTDK